MKRALSEKLAESIANPLPKATPRKVCGTVYFPGKATAVTGVRRAGKTTFLHQLRAERIREGVRQERLPYINFEDERLADLRADQLSFLVEEYGRRFPDLLESGPVYWNLDEIQVVPGWERFVRRLLDTGGNEVVVTGSSAALLSREIATSLRGRAWEVPIYPFSFGEALRHQALEIPEDPRFLTPSERARIEGAFEEWLATGGFPEAQTLDPATRHQLLRDYVDVAMLRDVVERHRVGNVAGLRWLVRHLLGNPASSFSVEKFYGALKSQGFAISKDTIHQLLAHLEDCFLVRLLWMESVSERQRMVNPRKSYPVDSGLIPVFDRSGRRNLGHALETAVLIELQRRHAAITYVKTPSGYEVDFLARDGAGHTDLIQVCDDAADPATAERELRALVEAGEAHAKARMILLVLNRDGSPPESPPGIVVQPAYEWMLTGHSPTG